MKKTYEVIYVEGNRLVVDKEAEIINNDWYYWNKQVFECSRNGLHLPNSFKIIASENKIGDLSLIRFEEEMFNLDDEITKLNTTSRYDSDNRRYNYSESDIILLFNKTAKAKGEYSLEDLRKAWSSSGIISTGEGQIGTINFEQFIQSLKPKVKSVELEMEEYMTAGWIPSYNNPDNNNLEEPAELDIRIKVNKDGYVIQTKINYHD